MDYCKLTNYPRAIPLDFNGVRIMQIVDFFDFRGKPTYRVVAIPELWEQSFDLQRQREDIAKQEALDDEWRLWDAAADGNELAQLHIKTSRRRKPESRVAEKSNTGLPSRSTFSGEVIPYSFSLSKLSTCKACGCDMAVSDKRYHYCSPECAASVKAARVKRNNDKRQNVKHEQKECIHCCELFTPKRSDAMFCSTKCRVASYRATA